jgi:hypothetical protein
MEFYNKQKTKKPDFFIDINKCFPASFCDGIKKKSDAEKLNKHALIHYENG